MMMSSSHSFLWVLFLLLIIAAVIPCNEAAPQGSLITQLPGFNGPLPSQHYGGYVSFNGKNLYYYFVSSERNPSKDPVVLWLNGGPGCSSFDGFVYEHGPFNYEKGSSNGSLPILHLNPYGWSKVSNMIYLDSPCGVGLSYSNNKSNYITDDFQTAIDSHTFLLKWFELYPEFAKNPFYISGESYAGVYVPMLSSEVVKGQSSVLQSGESRLYYLHPGESPSHVLVSTLLNEFNYQEWSRAMRRALSSKHKLPLISDTFRIPDENDKSYEDWQCCNDMVVSWIISSVEPTIAKSVNWYDTAAEVWSHLRRRFGRGNSYQIVRLKADLCSLKQGSLSVNVYFSQFKSLWEKYCQFRPIVRCNHAPDAVECDSEKSSRKDLENDQLLQFLVGLNESFEAVRSQIMLMDPLPDIERALFLAQQHEHQMLSGLREPVAAATTLNAQGNGIRYEPAVYAANSNYKSRQNDDRRSICTYCHKVGHTIDKCFKKHGYPPNWKFGPRRSAAAVQVDNAPSILGEPPQHTACNLIVNRDVTYGVEQGDQSLVMNVNQGLNQLSLTPEQVTGLIALVQRSTAQHKEPAPHTTATNYHTSGPDHVPEDW